MNDRGGPAGRLCVRAPAKVNLYLEILGTRPDGFHEVRTVMQAVSLFDELEFTSRPDGEVQLACSDPNLPAGEQNLVVRAARLLRRSYGVSDGADITLHKRIPVGGGLGGGSSDCAVTLLALCALWNLDAPVESLAELAAELGSDVRFFMRGGAALCEGRGERVSPLPGGERMHYVLIMPPCHVSTARVYGAWQTALTTRVPDRNNVLRALGCGDPQLLGRSLRNDLEPHALALYPELTELRGRLMSSEVSRDVVGTLLSGSGSSFFAVAHSEEHARRAADILCSELDVRCAAVHSVPPWDGSSSLLAVGRTHR